MEKPSGFALEITVPSIFTDEKSFVVIYYSIILDGKNRQDDGISFRINRDLRW